MSFINYEKDGAVGVVSMAKPPHNLLDNALLAELTSAYSEVVEEGCRSILLRSSMRHFCAGADLEAIASERQDQAGLERLWRALEDVIVSALARDSMSTSPWQRPCCRSMNAPVH
jgi:enoyl-CoA hydratase/carnithine racemase